MKTPNAELRRIINRRARQLAALQEVKICLELGLRARELHRQGFSMSAVIEMLEREPQSTKLA